MKLRLDQTDGVVTVEACDNGKGFDPTTSFPGHLGLHSMQERVKSLGGELRIESTPGQGTCIYAQIPVHNATNHTGSLTAYCQLLLIAPFLHQFQAASECYAHSKVQNCVTTAKHGWAAWSLERLPTSPLSIDSSSLHGSRSY